MASVVFRGKAVVEGTAGAFDVLIYPLQQTLKVTQNFEEEVVKDLHGFDVSWLARNEHFTQDVGMKFLGDTAAHSIIPVTPGASLSGGGQPFLAPFAKVTLSGFSMAVFNTTWQVISGTSLDQGNTKVADGDYKLRAYADATQNTAAVTTPA